VVYESAGNVAGVILIVENPSKCHSKLEPWTGCRKSRIPEFIDNRHIKVVRLSTLSTGHIYHPGNIPWLGELNVEWTSGSWCNRKFEVNEKSRHPQTSACRAVPQKTVPLWLPQIPHGLLLLTYNLKLFARSRRLKLLLTRTYINIIHT
jgi:hypothetical protein